MLKIDLKCLLGIAFNHRHLQDINYKVKLEVSVLLLTWQQCSVQNYRLLSSCSKLASNAYRISVTTAGTYSMLVKSETPTSRWLAGSFSVSHSSPVKVFHIGLAISLLMPGR